MRALLSEEMQQDLSTKEKRVGTHGPAVSRMFEMHKAAPGGIQRNCCHVFES